MKIFQLIYRSFAEIGFKLEDMGQILEACTRNNPGLNITGMLLYKDGIFLQMIEGKESDVRFLYDKITRDKRHAALTIYHEAEAESRSFPNWSMVYKDLSELDKDLSSKFNHIINLDFGKDDFQSSSGLDLFLSIKESL